jgi:hypothetical protein
VIFALKNIHHNVNINQQNRLHPYYLVYVSNDGKVLADHTEVKRLLDLIRASCKGRNEPLHDICRLFNGQTDDGRSMGRYSQLLSDAIRSMIDVKEEKDIDSLFSGGRTSALVNAIAGLEDFRVDRFPCRAGCRLMSALFAYPKAAEFGRSVPKAKIYGHAGASTRIRQVLSIRWTRSSGGTSWLQKP